MVGQSYLLEQPPAPAGLNAVLNQRVLPVLVNVAGSVEGRFETMAGVIRRSPTTCVLVVASLGFLLARAAQMRGA